MRACLLVLLIAACGPKVASTPRIVEDDLDLPPPGATGYTAPPAATEPDPPAAIKPDPPAAAAPPRSAPKKATWPPVAAHPAPEPPLSERPDSQRIVAPPGKGLRTGTIARDQLLAILDAGPGNFLRQLEVAPRLAGDRFVGWQLVQLIDRNGPLNSVDLVTGDVLLAINDHALSRPEQFQTLWDALRTANEVKAHLWRGDMKFDLHFKIEPPVR